MPHSDASVTPGRAGWIYYVAEDGDGNTLIARTNFDGSVVQPLTEPGPIVRTPTVSPDGTRVAYTRTERLNGDIWVMDADGSNPQQLTTSSGNDFAPAWSPDGPRIYFSSNRDGSQIHVFVMNADGTARPQPHGAPRPRPFTRAVARRPQRGLHELAGDIWVMDVDGGDFRNVTPSTAASGEFDPAWSPDGSTLAFTSSRTGMSHVFLARADGAGVRQLTLGETPELSRRSRPTAAGSPSSPARAAALSRA